MSQSVLNRLYRRGTTTEQPLAGNESGAMYVNQELPISAVLAARGQMWRAKQATATASVTAMPTGTAAVSLQNGEADDGLWYVIYAVTSFNAANAAAVDAVGLVHCITDIPGTLTLTQDIAKTSIKGYRAAQGGYNGKAIIDLAATITDDLWEPVGTTPGSTGVASAAGGTTVIWLPVPIILPPKGIHSLQSTATSTSATTAKGWIWAEVSKGMLFG